MWGGGTGQACTWLKTLKSLTRTVTIHQLRLRCGRWTGQWTPIYITFTTYITYTTFLGPSHNVTHARTLLIKRNYSHISLSFLLFGGKHNTTQHNTQADVVPRIMSQDPKQAPPPLPPATPSQPTPAATPQPDSTQADPTPPPPPPTPPPPPFDPSRSTLFSLFVIFGFF